MADERIRQAVKITDPTTDANEAGVDASGNLQTIDANLAVAAALSDTLANPTTTQVGANLLGYDRVNDEWTRIAGVIDGEVIGALNAGFLALGTDGSNYQVLSTDSSGVLQVDLATAVPAIDAEGDDDSVAFAQSQQRVLTLLYGSNGSEWERLTTDGSGSLDVNITGGAAGVTHTDDAAFTEAVDDGVPAFGLFHDVTPPLVTEGRAGIVRISANRNLYETIRDAAGNERGVNVTAANELNVILGANDGVDIGDVDVASVIPGVGATNLGKAESATHTTGDVGVLSLGIRQDAASALAAAGEYIAPIFDGSGRLHVTDPNAGAGTPGTPTVENPALANIAGGATSIGTELRTSDLGGNTHQLAGIDISSSAPFKATIIQEDNDVETVVVRGLFGRAGEPLQWRPPNKAYFNVTFGATGGFDGWRVEVTNLDNSQTTDFYATFYYED